MHLLVSLTLHGWHSAALRVDPDPSPAALMAAARRADAAGVDAVLFGMPAHGPANIRFDSLPLIGAAVGATARVGLGAYWPFDVAEPFHVARVFATLDHLSGGRALWVTGLTGARALQDGFGYRPLVEDAHAAARRATEFVSVVEDLLDSWEDRGFVVDQATGRFADPERVHPIHHSGAYFTVRGPLNVPRPPQGRPVIVHRDSGNGPMREAAAAFADAIVVAPSGLDDAIMLRGALRQAATAAGRAVAPKVIASALLVLAETDATARDRAAALDATDPLDALSLVGAPESVADIMRRWIAAGASDGFDLRPAVLSEDVEPLAALVAATARPAPEGETVRARLGLPRPASRFSAE
jgi:alkanesulfonate monooxygenase SsuD/methylene tetrahydromethanopterin reductase-like flavin-dependent oxidoreductase (luciferase family)